MARLSATLLVLVGVYSVQGSDMDLPKLAGLIQKSNGTHHSAWKAQAQTFIGLLESMGKVVPANQTKDTRAIVKQLIDLLIGASGDLRKAAESGKANKTSEMSGFIDSVKEYDQNARTTLTSTRTKNGELTTCLAMKRALEATHQNGCSSGGQSLIEGGMGWAGCSSPPACKQMEETKKYSFAASSKFTWQCNFTAGETDSSCTADSSDLKTDLKDKKKDLMDKYLEWLDLQDTCAQAKKNCTSKCNTQEKGLGDWTSKCNAMFVDANELLCDFTGYVHTREEFAGKMDTSMSQAPTLLDAQNVEWLDLQLIICVLQRFSDNLTFGATDYSTCQAQTQGNAFVTNPDVPARPSTLSAENIQFGTGLADMYMGKEAAASGQKITLRLTDVSGPQLYVQRVSQAEVLVCDKGVYEA